MNEWSDRPTRPHHKGYVASTEFWLGVVATLVTLVIAIGVIAAWS